MFALGYTLVLLVELDNAVRLLRLKYSNQKQKAVDLEVKEGPHPELALLSKNHAVYSWKNIILIRFKNKDSI